MELEERWGGGEGMRVGWKQSRNVNNDLERSFSLFYLFCSFTTAILRRGCMCVRGGAGGANRFIHISHSWLLLYIYSRLFPTLILILYVRRFARCCPAPVSLLKGNSLLLNVFIIECSTDLDCGACGACTTDRHGGGFSECWLRGEGVVVTLLFNHFGERSPPLFDRNRGVLKRGFEMQVTR